MNPRIELIKCILCEECCLSQSCDLDAQQLYSGRKPYECEFCHKCFKNNGSLNLHKKAHMKPFRCKICARYFTTHVSLKNHEIFHSKIKPHECEVCKKNFAYTSSLIKHEKIHTKGELLKCEICNEGFVRKTDLKEHKVIHITQCPFECEVCHERFAISSSLNWHRRTHAKNQYKCEACNKYFTYDGVKKLNVHPKDVPQKCFTFSTPNKHIETHNGEGTVRCDICSSVKKSEVFHAKESPYECEV